MKSFRTLRLSLKAKLIVFLSKKLKKGSGTSLPGISVEKRYQNVLTELGNDFDEIIFISGTNGKTTTRALLSHIFEANGVKICTNRGGANLIRGIATSLLLNLDFQGKPKSKTAIFEVEEASLPLLTKYIQPHKLILTNIFRDQLDVYGEINQTKNYFSESLKNITQAKKNFELIINGEDGMLTDLISNMDIPVSTFSADVREEQELKYEKQNNLKPAKNWKNYLAKEILTADLKTTFSVEINGQKHKVNSLLPGIFNIYNILAALIVGYQKFGKQVIKPIESFKPPFGRGEKVRLSDSEITLFLIKNPAGFDQVLNLITSNFPKKEIDLAICINDNIADGRDVSWLWDTNLEKFVRGQKLGEIYTSGTRALDMLLRLEYAQAEVSLENNFENLEKLINQIEKDKSNFIILSTYTATLELRKILGNKTELKSIDEQGN